VKGERTAGDGGIEPVEAPLVAKERANEAAQAFSFGGRIFHHGSRSLRFDDGGRIVLPAAEADLLLALLCHAGRTMTRDEICAATGRGYAPHDRTVDVLIGRLRRKLRDDGVIGLLQTVRGVGYRLNTTVERVAVKGTHARVHGWSQSRSDRSNPA